MPPNGSVNQHTFDLLMMEESCRFHASCSCKQQGGRGGRAVFYLIGTWEDLTWAAWGATFGERVGVSFSEPRRFALAAQQRNQQSLGGHHGEGDDEDEDVTA